MDHVRPGKSCAFIGQGDRPKAKGYLCQLEADLRRDILGGDLILLLEEEVLYPLLVDLDFYLFSVMPLAPTGVGRWRYRETAVSMHATSDVQRMTQNDIAAANAFDSFSPTFASKVQHISSFAVGTELQTFNGPKI